MASSRLYFCREVVERRTYTVTGQKASAEEIDRLIETGESEQIFQKAILEQGRGHVRPCLSSDHSLLLLDRELPFLLKNQPTAGDRTPTGASLLTVFHRWYLSDCHFVPAGYLVPAP